MNNEQRKYLVGQVEKTYSTQLEILENDRPVPPSLNNYLVAACLDNTLKLVSVEAIKTVIRNKVLNFGTNEVLVEEDDNGDRYYRSRRKKPTSVRHKITLPAEEIFVLPKTYLTALQTYTEEIKKSDEKIKVLTAQKETIIMKIQIGSNASLDKLIGQADNLADLNIMNSQLLLTE